MTTVYEKITSKLNLEKGTKLLVVHQDDIGMCHGANTAFTDLCGIGFVNCGSLMPPCPWSLETLEICKSQKDLDIGIHLTLTSEYNFYKWRPLSGANRNTGLVDANGFFWPTVPEVEKNASLDSVEVELRMQIEVVLESGINISHMDCHMATALAPKFQDIYLKLSKEYNIPGIFPRDYSAFNISAQANETKNKGLDKTVDVQQDVHQKKVENLELNEKMVIFDHFAMSPFAKKGENAKLIKDILSNLNTGLTYLALHPNAPGEIEKIDPEQWHIRTEEHTLFKDTEFLEWIKTINNLHCISMREIKSLIF
tara:strand:- start:68 stop:1000 length:933 start_codon:yes stop_codon:yes gene_type:complete